MSHSQGIRTEAVSDTYDVLGRASALLDLGLQAARASAGARRVAEGGSMDAFDVQAFTELADLFERSSRTVEFVASYGRAGRAPSEAFAAEVEVAIGAAITNQAAHGDPSELSVKLADLANEIRAFVGGGYEPATRLADFFSLFSNAVLGETASVGETVTTF